VNVDYGAEADIEADLLEPLPDAIVGVQRAYVGHFLEHLTPAEGIAFLAGVRERMAAGGLLVVVGPDVQRARAQYTARLIPQWLLEACEAHGDPVGHDRTHCHLWDCTGPLVVQQLTDAGWTGAEEFTLGDLTSLHPDIPLINGSTWQFAAHAIAGGN
jgi:hypothetical protein